MAIRSASFAALAAVLAAACASAPPEESGVAVFHAPQGTPRAVPEGCRLLGSHAPVRMTELEMTGSHDPFRRQRTRAAASGGNLLLVRSRVLIPRRDFHCPASSPITDCAPSEGSWNEVVFEDYSCTPAAIQALRDARR